VAGAIRCAERHGKGAETTQPGRSDEGLGPERRWPGSGETATPIRCKPKFGRALSRMLLRNRKGVTTSTWHLFYIRYISAICGSSKGYPFEVCEDKLPWPYSQGFEGFMHVGVCHTTSNFHEFDGITPPSQAGHDRMAGCWHFSVCLAKISSKSTFFKHWPLGDNFSVMSPKNRIYPYRKWVRKPRPHFLVFKCLERPLQLLDNLAYLHIQKHEHNQQNHASKYKNKFS
jgi:hypothetical protein